jgi:hypothetical protein
LSSAAERDDAKAHCVARVLHGADRQAVTASWSDTNESSGDAPEEEEGESTRTRGGSMCGVLPSEAARARPVDREVVFLADVAARTERLLGRPASLPLVLSCFGRGNDLARDDQTRGGASTEPWSARELNDHHCQRLKVAGGQRARACCGLMVVDVQEAAVAFGCNVDWSRTVRTDADPLYRSFVEWQVTYVPTCCTTPDTTQRSRLHSHSRGATRCECCVPKERSNAASGPPSSPSIKARQSMTGTRIWRASHFTRWY